MDRLSAEETRDRARAKLSQMIQELGKNGLAGWHVRGVVRRGSKDGQWKITFRREAGADVVGKLSVDLDDVFIEGFDEDAPTPLFDDSVLDDEPPSADASPVVLN